MRLYGTGEMKHSPTVETRVQTAGCVLDDSSRTSQLFKDAAVHCRHSEELRLSPVLLSENLHGREHSQAGGRFTGATVTTCSGAVEQRSSTE